MTKLLNKYKEIKRTKKGFTLVELLVVIAILAVLASVSVVGYLGFTTKARNSNALTEMTQIREVVRDNLLDGDAHEYTYEKASGEGSSDKKATFKYTATTGTTTTYSLSIKLTGAAANDTGSAILKGSFTDLNSLSSDSEIKVVTSDTSVTTSTTAAITITSIAYKTASGAYAQWTINDGDVANIEKTTYDALNDFKVVTGS